MRLPVSRSFAHRSDREKAEAAAAKAEAAKVAAAEAEAAAAAAPPADGAPPPMDVDLDGGGDGGAESPGHLAMLPPSPKRGLPPLPMPPRPPDVQTEPVKEDAPAPSFPLEATEVYGTAKQNSSKGVKATFVEQVLPPPLLAQPRTSRLTTAAPLPVAQRWGRLTGFLIERIHADQRRKIAKRRFPWRPEHRPVCTQRDGEPRLLHRSDWLWQLSQEGPLQVTTDRPAPADLTHCNHSTDWPAPADLTHCNHSFHFVHGRAISFLQVPDFGGRSAGLSVSTAAPVSPPSQVAHPASVAAPTAAC